MEIKEIERREIREKWAISFVWKNKEGEKEWIRGHIHTCNVQKYSCKKKNVQKYKLKLKTRWKFFY